MGTQKDRSQLYYRIAVRRAMLEATQKRLKSNPHTSHGERLRAVDRELAALDAHLRSDWSRLDQVSEAQLNHWLGNTRFLADPNLGEVLALSPLEHGAGG
jgi:hypothetical protein